MEIIISLKVAEIEEILESQILHWTAFKDHAGCLIEDICIKYFLKKKLYVIPSN